MDHQHMSVQTKLFNFCPKNYLRCVMFLFNSCFCGWLRKIKGHCTRSLFFYIYFFIILKSFLTSTSKNVIILFSITLFYNVWNKNERFYLQNKNVCFCWICEKDFLSVFNFIWNIRIQLLLSLAVFSSVIKL